MHSGEFMGGGGGEGTAFELDHLDWTLDGQEQGDAI